MSHFRAYLALGFPALLRSSDPVIDCTSCSSAFRTYQRREGGCQEPTCEPPGLVAFAARVARGFLFPRLHRQLKKGSKAGAQQKHSRMSFDDWGAAGNRRSAAAKTPAKDSEYDFSLTCGCAHVALSVYASPFFRARKLVRWNASARTTLGC
jgi:hypothetical protein